jgi:hypothetical protein
MSTHFPIKDVFGDAQTHFGIAQHSATRFGDAHYRLGHLF